MGATVKMESFVGVFVGILPKVILWGVPIYFSSSPWSTFSHHRNWVLEMLDDH